MKALGIHFIGLLKYFYLKNEPNHRLKTIYLWNSYSR